MPSSVIRSFDYDPAAHRLDVQVVSGRRHFYLDVPERVALATGAIISTVKKICRIRIRFEGSEIRRG